MSAIEIKTPEYYKQYQTHPSKLNYTTPDEDETKYIKKYKFRLQLFLFIFFAVFSASGIIAFILSKTEWYINIFTVVMISAALYSLYRLFFGKCYVFHAILIDSYTDSESTRFVGVWSEKHKQYCNLLKWCGIGWYADNRG